jgi:hypothetical protein
MNFSVGGIIELAVTIAVFAILCVITYVIFVFGKQFVAFIGTSGYQGRICNCMDLMRVFRVIHCSLGRIPAG